MIKRKDKNADEGYLLPDDIEQIIEDYSPIEIKIKNQEGTVAESYLNLLCDLVEDAIHARKKDIIRRRKTERALEETTAALRDFEQAPRYYRPLRRLFRKTPNRAMQLIIDREELNAREIHFEQEVQNDLLESEISMRENNYHNQTEEQPFETSEYGQNLDEGASDEREQAEHTDEQTPEDKPEETPTDGAQDQPTDDQTEDNVEELPRRRSRNKGEETSGNTGV